MSFPHSATRFRLKRTRQAVRPGEFQAELWALRDDWVIIGVVQLFDSEWTDLAALADAVGIEVNGEAKA